MRSWGVPPRWGHCGYEGTVWTRGGSPPSGVAAEVLVPLSCGRGARGARPTGPRSPALTDFFPINYNFGIA